MRPLFLLFAALAATLYAESFQQKMLTSMEETNTTFKTSLLDCFDGNAEACLKAGEYYSANAYKQCDNTPEQISADTATLYKMACDLGSAKGCTAYAMIYTADRHKDPQKSARYYFQRGCDNGDFNACTMLKMMPQDQQ